MGKPGPQPKSITVAPLGSIRAHSRTAFTPMPFDRALHCLALTETRQQHVRIHWIDQSLDNTFSPAQVSLAAIQRTLSIRCSVSPRSWMFNGQTVNWTLPGTGGRCG